MNLGIFDSEEWRLNRTYDLLVQKFPNNHITKNSKFKLLEILTSLKDPDIDYVITNRKGYKLLDKQISIISSYELDMSKLIIHSCAADKLKYYITTELAKATLIQFYDLQSIEEEFKKSGLI